MIFELNTDKKLYNAPVGVGKVKFYGERIRSKSLRNFILYFLKSFQNKFLYDEKVLKSLRFIWNLDNLKDKKKYLNKLFIYIQDTVISMTDMMILKSAQDELFKFKSKLVNIYPSLKDTEKYDLYIGKILRRLDIKMNEKFYGLTYKQRIKYYRNIFYKQFKNLIIFSTNEQNFLYNAERMFNGNMYGYNMFRVYSKIMVSESFRARQNVVKILGEEIQKDGYTVYIRWILSNLPGRKRDICDVYANKIVIRKNLGILKRGLYPLNKVPEYPHPFCYCHLDLEVI